MRVVLIDHASDTQVATLEVPEAMVYGYNASTRFWTRGARWKLEHIEWRQKQMTTGGAPEVWEPFVLVSHYQWHTKH